MLRVDLGPVTEVRETTKRQVRHRLREQRKVSGSLFSGGQCSINQKSAKIAFLKEITGR